MFPQKEKKGNRPRKALDKNKNDEEIVGLIRRW